VEVVISLTVETCVDLCNGFNDAFVEGDGIIVEIYLSSVSNRQTIIQDTISKLSKNVFILVQVAIKYKTKLTTLLEQFQVAIEKW
jgi:hypothetical protein